MASAYTKFIYHESLLVLELDGLDSDAVLRKYTWGCGLSGTLGGAGGIGGLHHRYGRAA